MPHKINTRSQTSVRDDVNHVCSSSEVDFQRLQNQSDSNTERSQTLRRTLLQHLHPGSSFFTYGMRLTQFIQHPVTWAACESTPWLRLEVCAASSVGVFATSTAGGRWSVFACVRGERECTFRLIHWQLFLTQTPSTQLLRHLQGVNQRLFWAPRRRVE